MKQKQKQKIVYETEMSGRSDFLSVESDKLSLWIHPSWQYVCTQLVCYSWKDIEFGEKNLRFSTWFLMMSLGESSCLVQSFFFLSVLPTHYILL